MLGPSRGQRPGAIGEYFVDGRLVRAVHESTCSHCQRITSFPSMKRMMDHVEICRGCMKLICLQCAGKPCLPWEKQCDMEEAEFRLRKRLEIDSWRCY